MLKEILVEETARRLGRNPSSVANAVRRGVFTLSPRSAGKKYLLYQDQVDLFQGKELALVNLSTEEYAKWLEIASLAAANRIQREKLQGLIDQMSSFPKAPAIVR